MPIPTYFFNTTLLLMYCKVTLTKRKTIILTTHPHPHRLCACNFNDFCVFHIENSFRRVCNSSCMRVSKSVVMSGCVLRELCARVCHVSQCVCFCSRRNQFKDLYYLYLPAPNNVRSQNSRTRIGF